MDPLLLIGLVAAAFAAAVVGGLAGIGSAIMMIPVLTFAVGIRDAVPIVTVAVMMQTWSRIWVNREMVDWGVVRWFVIGALPASVLGAVAFANLPAELLQTALAVFLLAVVAYRHSPFVRKSPLPLRLFVGVGAGQGFLSAIFGGAGPFGASFFLAYGLRRGAFVGTMACAMTAINLVKMSVYGTYELLDGSNVGLAVGLGVVMIAGAAIGGMVTNRVSDRAFVVIVEVVIVGCAVWLLAQ